NSDRLLIAKRQAATTNDLMLLIPEDAKAGTYTVKVGVSFDRGHGFTEKTFPITVNGKTASSGTGMINVANAAQSIVAGQGAVFKVGVANLGTGAQTFTLDVRDVNAWGTTRVNPQTLPLAQNAAGEFNLYVSPAESTSGIKVFTVAVRDAQGNVVGEKTLTLDVASSINGGDAVKQALQIGFIALLAILVLVGLVIIIKRLTADEPEEPVQGKTYY
ncbi:hypothetical protein HZB00_00585, partial [Candidatus Woesearchaeota archaeon]|nr:hypothetical protein [Candidatus Woesearchaeota archaeon]